MLRLVHPGDGGNLPSRRPKGRRAPSLSLTVDEARHLRAAVSNIARTRYGSLRKLAAALEVDPDALSRKARHLGPAVAVAMWRLTGVPLEELLRGRLEAAPEVSP